MLAERLLLVDATIRINCSIEIVFDYVSDHENYERWFPEVISVKAKYPNGESGIEKEYEEIIRLPTGRQRAMTITVVNYEVPHHFETVGEFPPLLPNMRVDCNRGGEQSTLLRLRFYSRQQKRLVRILLRLLIRPTLRRNAKKGLVTLKRILEAPAER